jgi:hypothetical protein
LDPGGFVKGRMMRRAILLLAIFGFIGSAWSEEAAVSTWVLNAGKSSYPLSVPIIYGGVSQFVPARSTIPAKLTMVMRRQKKGFVEVTRTGQRLNGTPIFSRSLSPEQGGMLKANSPAASGVSYVFTRIDDHNSFVTCLLNGKQFSVILTVLSAEGRTMTQTTRYAERDIDGRVIEQTEVYEQSQSIQ